MKPVFAVAVLLVACGFVAAQEEKRDFKRRDTASEEDLRKQLLKIPEAGFDQAAANFVQTFVQKNAAAPPTVGRQLLIQYSVQRRRPDWIALPWRTGVDSQIGKEPAERLHVFSINLRTCMQRSVPGGDVRPDVAALRKLLVANKQLTWNKSEAVPTLAQMLQVENAATRALMIEMLADIQGKEASVTLAQRAIFDLSAEIREKAVQALAHRPRAEFKQVVLDALRWPWAPAVDHAVETAIALEWKDLVPDMIDLLKEPDPKLPFAGEKEKGTYVRELVRINHLCNCLLCHAPSPSRDDLVRGLVPVPGRELAPAYYSAATGTFVRADITYLRQDFSLAQPVENQGKWPSFQRYDYLLRTRGAMPEEVKLLQAIKQKPAESYPQRDALLFGLRELTGRDPGSRTEAWLELRKAIREKKD